MVKFSLIFVVVLCCCCCCCCSCISTEQSSVNIFVAPMSYESGTGTLTSPFSRLSQATHLARQFKNRPVNIWLRAGTYYLNQTFKLSDKDSRLPYAPLTISAYMDEKVEIKGTIRLPFWNKVVNGDVLARLPKSVRKSVFVTNLKQYGISDFGSPKGGGIELFHYDKKMQISRYPNNGHLTISKLVEPNTKIIRSHKGSIAGKFFYQGDFASRWGKETDIWLHGYWFWDWRDEKQAVNTIDIKRNIIELKKPYHGYGYRKGQNYYAYNLLAELDEPNEWYLDRVSGNLYLYPNSEIEKNSPPEVSILDNIIELTDVSNVTIKNISVSGSRANGISIKQGVNNTIEHVNVKHIGNMGVQIIQSPNSSIINSEIHSIGGIAITIDGGDRAKLISANICAINNKIFNYATVNNTFSPGISLNGVGNCVKHNNIFDSPYIGIWFKGNNHLIEYNEIHDVVKQSNDAGAIYAGRDWSARGTVIRHNYLHDINGYKGKGAKGIYLDDEFSGVQIYGNIFDNVRDAVFIGGGRDNIVDNNLFINSYRSIYIDVRGVEWGRGAITQLKNKLKKVPYQSTIWQKQYPELSNVLTVNSRLPVGNVVSNNVFFDRKWNSVYPKAKPYVSFKNNHHLVGSKPTDNYQVHKLLAGFNNIPFDKIGIKYKE